MTASDWLATCSDLVPPLNVAQRSVSLLLQSNQVMSLCLKHTPTSARAQTHTHTPFPSAICSASPSFSVAATECSWTHWTLLCLQHEYTLTRRGTHPSWLGSNSRERLAYITTAHIQRNTLTLTYNVLFHWLYTNPLMKYPTKHIQGCGSILNNSLNLFTF